MNRNPWLKFYPSDWRKDPALAACSLAAQGLWMRMLCIAYECEETGYLVINGKAMSNAQIARQIGADFRQIRNKIVELEMHAVFDRDERGPIFSRRMVRDAYLSAVRAQSGKHGGNPILVKQKQETAPDLVNQNSPVCLTKSPDLVKVPLTAVRSQKSESENPTPLVAPADASARPTQKTGGHEKTNSYNPVPLVTDTAGLDRHARKMGVDPERFSSYPELQTFLIAEGQRRRAAARGLR